MPDNRKSRAKAGRIPFAERLDTSPRVATLYLILWALTVFCLVRQVIWRNWEGVGVCVFALALFSIPRLVERQFHISIPPLFEGIIYAFIFAAQVLGEVEHFYTGLPGWDTALHTLNGFVAAALGFSMVYLLNQKSPNLRLSAGYMALVAFCFSMTVGACWEIVEFTGDTFFGQDMQKDAIVTSFNSVALDPNHAQGLVSVNGITGTTIHTETGDVEVPGGYLDIGLHDTMKDLIVNLIGAIVFTAFGYIYMKHRSRKSFAHDVVESLLVLPSRRSHHHDTGAHQAEREPEAPQSPSSEGTCEEKKIGA